VEMRRDGSHKARHGVALPPLKPGSWEAGESFVLCCRLLFAGSHLFFKPRFRSRAKPQVERSDSDEPPHLLPGSDASRDVPQAGGERGSFSRAAVHVPRSPVSTSRMFLSLLAPGPGGDRSHSEVG